MSAKPDGREKASFYKFFKKFPDEESAKRYFEEQRWGKDGKNRYCPHCGSFRTKEAKHKMPYRCSDCYKHFSIRTKSILAESNVPLHKWLMAIYLLNTNLKGVSNMKLARDLGIMQKTAWFLAHRIKEFMKEKEELLVNPVEADEIYMEGSEKNKDKSKRKHEKWRTKGKTAVLGVKERDSKKVRVRVSRDTREDILTNRLRSKTTPISTVGRNRSLKEDCISESSVWSDDLINISLGSSLDMYDSWEEPVVIISDGGYGILGFEGDTSDHIDLPRWYEQHIVAWSRHATPHTTLWFWNSEIGWAAVHPLLEKHGWQYVNTNIWNKGKGHIAGNVNTKSIRRFPVVTEVCVQYVFEARVGAFPLKEWLYNEWKRTGLPMRQANDACGVKDAATRKYFNQGHLWYYPPPEMFEKMQRYANKHGKPEGKPYFSLDGNKGGTAEEWALYRTKFDCPHGVTNVWDRPPLHGSERYKINGLNGKALHLNQKPLDLVSRIIEATSDVGEVVWEPFGGLFTASIAARNLGRRSFGAEIDPTYFYYGQKRVIEECPKSSLR